MGWEGFKKKKQEPREEKIDKSRRNFTKIALAVVVTAAVAPPVISSFFKNKKQEDERSEDTLTDEDRNLRSPENLDESFLDVLYQPKIYTLGSIADRRISKKDEKGNTQQRPIQFNKLLSEYTGIKGPVQKEVEIDFRYQLAMMWKSKLAQMKEANNGVYPDGTLRHVKNIFTSYDKSAVKSMSLESYRQEIKRTLETTRASLDLNSINKLPAFRRLSQTKIGLLKAFEKNINQDSLLAYVLTELMPTRGASAPMGIEIFEELLRHGGREYIARIPALADAELSFGDYQFTPKALGEEYNQRPGKRAGSVIKEENFAGASQINKLFKNRMIPKHVGDLRGEQHHAAAYLYAIYNLALFVGRLTDSQSEALLKDFSRLPQNLITEFIASAHHLPDAGIKALVSYSDDFIEYQKLSLEERQKNRLWDFAEHCTEKSKRVGAYCSKTTGNIDALKARLKIR